ncbi:hypothetical protein [Providencia sp.]|uniref:hypothetical protein n=1 Tax=Providencia sp. TaxID=589 RepID=UPI003341D2DC
MSNKDKITKIGNELSEYRKNAQEVVSLNLHLYAKILLQFASIRENNELSDEIKNFCENVSLELNKEIKPCLIAIEKYNTSLTNDYGAAIKTLTKLKEEL